MNHRVVIAACLRNYTIECKADSNFSVENVLVKIEI